MTGSKCVFAGLASANFVLVSRLVLRDIYKSSERPQVLCIFPRRSTLVLPDALLGIRKVLGTILYALICIALDDIYKFWVNFGDVAQLYPKRISMGILRNVT